MMSMMRLKRRLMRSLLMKTLRKRQACLPTRLSVLARAPRVDSDNFST